MSKLINDVSVSILITAHYLNHRLSKGSPSKSEIFRESESKTYAGCTKVLGDFESRGLVEFKPSGRSTQVVMTEKGEKMVEHLREFKKVRDGQSPE